MGHTNVLNRGWGGGPKPGCLRPATRRGAGPAGQLEASPFPSRRNRLQKPAALKEIDRSVYL